MVKYCIVILVIVGCFACKQNDTEDVFFIYDKKNGVLKINNEGTLNLNRIELNNQADGSQYIILDSNKRINLFQNIIHLEKKKEYVNTWVGFDLQGNFLQSESYYYQTFLSEEDTTIYVNCFLPNLLIEDSRAYILTGSFDRFFNSKNHLDTLFFSDDYLVKIPLHKAVKGNNNIKFIIVEDKLTGNKLKYKKTYVDKNFFLR